jgi:hypothetical protein
MALPLKGTKAWVEEVKFYQGATPFELAERAEYLGYKPGSYRRMMLARGIRKNGQEFPETTWRIKVKEEGLPEKIIDHVPYPKFDLLPFPPPKTNRDQEDMVVVISDWHLCKVTADYNIDIAKKRIDFLTTSIMKVASLHYPIRKLWIFDAGDTVQGENIHQGSKVGEVSHSAEEQIFDFAIPILSKMMVTLNQGIPKIEYLTVRSNHGKYGKEANPKTNWQTVMAKSLKAALIEQKNITVDVPDKWYQLVNIQGFRFFLFHGDQFWSKQGTPLISIKSKLPQWQAKYKFHFAYMGHFHSKSYTSVNDIADVTVAPPLVTGDEWAEETVGSNSVPKQMCFGVHKVYGRTFCYDLFTDKNYLPIPIDEQEGLVKIGENPNLLAGEAHADNNVKE